MSQECHALIAASLPGIFNGTVAFTRDLIDEFILRTRLIPLDYDHHRQDASREAGELSAALYAVAATGSTETPRLKPILDLLKLREKVTVAIKDLQLRNEPDPDECRVPAVSGEPLDDSLALPSMPPSYRSRPPPYDYRLSAAAL